MIELLLYIALFIAFSGLLALVDAAILSVTRAEVEEMVLHGSWGSTPLRALKQRIPRAVVVIVIVTNTINVLGPILVGQKAVQIYGSTAIGVITAVLTFGTIVFSEIIPKSVGSHYAPVISRVSAPVILALVVLLYPIVVALERLSNLLTTGSRRIGTEAQIRSLVTIGRSAGYIESDEGQLIHRAFILNDKTAEDIMTPLKDVVGIDATATIRQAAQRVMNNEFSRLPVFGKSIHDIRGMVISRDLLDAISAGRDDEPVLPLVREALVVSAEERSDHLLAIFRDRHIHLAVVQKDGKTVGVVTLEDVLEELVGEIEDETDVQPST